MMWLRIRRRHGGPGRANGERRGDGRTRVHHDWYLERMSDGVGTGRTERNLHLEEGGGGGTEGKLGGEDQLRSDIY